MTKEDFIGNLHQASRDKDKNEIKQLLKLLKNYPFYADEVKSYDVIKKQQPEINNDLCTQGDLGNILHLCVRSGFYNNTLKKIMEIAKTKHQELPVLCALTQVFKKHEFSDKNTPIDFAWQEVLIAQDEKRDTSCHEETISIMKSFMREFTNTCCKTISNYKQSPHIAYSSWEDNVTEVVIKSKKELIVSKNCCRLFDV